MNRVINTSQRGFTLIELLLAMSFVSLLLMSITLTVIQITNIYTKGLTMRAVDQTGQALVRDIRSSIQSARPLDVGTTNAGGGNYKPMVMVGGDINKPDGGRLCTGSYSYIWNNGQALSNPVNKYEASSDRIRLVKIRDNGGLYCSDPSRTIDHSLATEMLNAGDRELAVQSMTIHQVAQSLNSGQALYQISFELGTNDQEALAHNSTINTTDTSCKSPADNQGLTDYCAVDKFEFTARTSNTGGGV